MANVKINKVALNIGVGDPGEKLQKAEKLLETLVSQKPVRTYAKATISEWSVKKNTPIGVKVILRGQKAHDFLKKSFAAVDNTVSSKKFDRNGNLSFGVKEYLELPGVKYNPDIGMFGFDVSVNVEKLGYRIARRKIAQRKIPKSALLTKEESMAFFREKFGIDITD